MNTLVKQRRLDRKNEYIALLGGECRACKSTDNLEFDHIDPGNVNFRVGGHISMRRRRILRELKLCQLLCHDCHMARTCIQRAVRAGTFQFA